MGRPLAEVRREAEEALATVAMRYPNGWGSYDSLSVCTDALRALLAEPAGETTRPATPPSTDPWRACGCADPDNCEHVYYEPPRLAPAAPAPPAAVAINLAPQSYPAATKDTCDHCQREITDGCYGVLCSGCDDTFRAVQDQMPTPAPDAVREAAERLRRSLAEMPRGEEYRNTRQFAAVRELLAAIDARPGGERGGE